MKNRSSNENQEFTLGSGGLLNHFFAKTGLADPSIPGTATRALLLVGLAWLPLLILSIVRGSAWGSKFDVPFLYDPGVNARFLIALPLLVMGESFIGRGLNAVVEYFATSGILKDGEENKFARLYKKTDRVLCSLIPEILIITFTILFSVLGWGTDVQHKFPVGVSNWYEISPWQKSPAGLWYLTFSDPLYRFLILRWLWRFLVWAFFLWRVSRLRLSLTVTHPDRAGGLGFLEVGQLKFGILAFAVSSQLAGLISRQIFFEGASIRSFEYMIAGYVVFTVLFFLAPLFIFTPQLVRSKRHGLIAYGGLAERYTDLFEKKWVKKEEKAGQEILGSSDIQSLADLANSFDVIHQMRLYPFSNFGVMILFASAVLPFLPLLFFVYGLNDLFIKAVQFIF